MEDMQAKVAKKLEELKIIEADFVRAWNERHFPEIQGTGEVVQNSFKLTPEMVSFILEWIPRLTNKHGSQECLVRALKRSTKPVDGAVLMDLFDKEDSSFYLKWAIGNTIALVKVLGVEQWIKEKLSPDRYAKENEMLVWGLGKYFDYDTAIAMLKKLFKNYPIHAAEAISKIGKEQDLTFLHEHFDEVGKDQRTAVKSAIKKLEKRLSKK
jgi:hypothetical protein